MISIIMAAHNAGKTIDMAIASVLAQNYEDFELIVVDDKSEDNTVDIVQGYLCDNRVKLIRNEKNMGVSLTRQRALEAAKGEWIAILDSDDLWEHTKLKKQLKVAEASDADIVFTGSEFMDQEGKMLEGYLVVPKRVGYRNLLKQNIISNSSVLVKSDLYEKYYVTGDDMHEDFAIWLQILKDGGKAYGINRPLLRYRLSDTSKSSNKIKAAKMNWNTYRYIGLSLKASIYYECCYLFNGIRKYSKIKR